MAIHIHNLYTNRIVVFVYTFRVCAISERIYIKEQLIFEAVKNKKWTS